MKNKRIIPYVPPEDRSKLQEGCDEKFYLSDVSNSVFLITEEQLSELIEKVSDKIQGILNREGRSAKGLALTNSVSDTIKTYLKRHC